MSNEEVNEYYINKRKEGKDLTQTCTELLDHCLGKKSRDNMTAIAVYLGGC